MHNLKIKDQEYWFNLGAKSIKPERVYLKSYNFWIGFIIGFFFSITIVPILFPY